MDPLRFPVITGGFNPIVYFFIVYWRFGYYNVVNKLEGIRWLEKFSFLVSIKCLEVCIVSHEVVGRFKIFIFSVLDKYIAFFAVLNYAESISSGVFDVYDINSVSIYEHCFSRFDIDWMGEDYEDVPMRVTSCWCNFKAYY